MPIAPDIYRRIVSAKLYIDGNFREPIDLNRLAREACLSRWHFHRLFTRIYRMTPHQYLTRKRIEQASAGLAGNALTIMEICNGVGFESLGSFSALFKKEVGQPPADFRQLARNRGRQVKDSPRSFIPHCFIETLTQKSNSQEAGPGSKT